MHRIGYDRGLRNDPVESEPLINAAIRSAVPTGRDGEAFPTLLAEQVERAGPFGSLKILADGTRVLEHGQRVADLFIVLPGCIELFDYDCDGAAQVFTKHRDQ